jgi:hypothetical protein
VIDNAAADVVTSPKIMILVQFLKIAIGRSDGIHTYRHSVDRHLYPLPGGKEFESLRFLSLKTIFPRFDSARSSPPESPDPEFQGIPAREEF